MISTRIQMDKLRCEDPDCHEDHQLFLNPLCHDGAPIRAALSGNVLDLTCAECDRAIHRIAVEIGYGDNVIIEKVKCECCDEIFHNIYSKCHRQYVDVNYTKKSGILEMVCSTCGKHAYMI